MAHWLEGDDPAQRAEKAGLLAHRPDDVIAYATGAETYEACDEVLALVRQHTESGGQSTTSTDEHPLVQAARLVPDDLCVLDGNGYRLVAGVVCFPNRWRLVEKLGLSVTGVHGPVPRYVDELAPSVDRVLGRLQPAAPVERRNWALLDDAALFQPEAGPAVGTGPMSGAVGHRVWARVERQTLLRLPRTGAVVFTIRTRQWRLDQLPVNDLSNLLAALTTVPPETAGYKRLTELARPVARWIETRLATGGEEARLAPTDT